MSQCAAQVFTGVSPENFACVQGKAAAQGIAMGGDQGSASKDGITVTWDYARPIAKRLRSSARPRLSS
jgi:hypothetical protein